MDRLERSLSALWVEPSGSLGVIDLVGVTPQAAYGTRKLRAAYTGAALRVRRSSDNSELDIGFTSAGDLDLTAMLAHTGAGQGYVVTWYDQSGNGNNVTQATAFAQPQIVVGGVAHAINSKCAINFDGVSWSLPRTGATFNFYAGNVVHNPSSVTGNRTMIEQTGTTSGPRWYVRNTGAVLAVLKNATIASGGVPGLAPQVSTGMRTNGTNGAAYLNGTLVGTSVVLDTTATVGNFQIGVSPLGGGNYAGNISEVLIFNSDLTTTQRQTLERNQGTYWGITVA